jgi:diguanylate cyclase (GGDEF)-like protein
MNRLEAALRNISEGLSIFDADRKLVICNERYAEIYELPPELTKPGASHAEITRHRLDRGLQPVGAENFLVRHDELVTKGESAVIAVQLGNGRTIRIRHQAMKDGGWVSTHQDITEEIAREQELEIQNFRFETALNNMRQGLCMYDRDRRLVVSNRRYAEMYKLRPEDVKPGMTLEEIIRQRVEAGNAPLEGNNAFVDKRVALVGEDEACAFDVEMSDGRIILIQHSPCRDGGYVATHEDVTEQRRNQARIQYMARHDALTDLPNRAFFSQHLEQVKARLDGGEIVGVLCIDLDHFKNVNDTLSHAAGDAALKTAGRALAACMCDGAIAARIGGDEFAVLTGRLERPEDAATIAERIVRAFAEPFEIEGHRAVLGASVGIAVGPLDGADGGSLVKHADLALYRAKKDGRGTYRFYENVLDMALQRRRETEAALRDALIKNEFRLAFQPLINLAESRICAFEALLRWRTPDRGLLGPASFINVAEETGLIAPIGEWVLRESCAAAAKWPDHIGLAVNLSPVQFRKCRNLVEQVEAALRSSSLAPRRLELEITESVLLSDEENVLLTLKRLKDLGVRIALDDFGSGYSSLSYLRRFPFDKIKIDRSFLQDLSHNLDSLAIVKAVIGLGRSLGIATTAEGVETEAQLDIVRGEGCTEAQGFLFSKPLPEKAANELARRGRGHVDAAALALTG